MGKLLTNDFTALWKCGEARAAFKCLCDGLRRTVREGPAIGNCKEINIRWMSDVGLDRSEYGWDKWTGRELVCISQTRVSEHTEFWSCIEVSPLSLRVCSICISAVALRNEKDICLSSERGFAWYLVDLFDKWSSSSLSVFHFRALFRALLVSNETNC